MNKPEKLIRTLRNRKMRIIAYFIATVCLAIAFAYCIHLQQKALTVCTSDDIKTIIAAVHMPPELSELLSSCFTIADIRSELTLFSFFFVCMLGLMLGFLIIELTGYSKDTLLVIMWDEIQELKTQINELKQKENTISQQTNAPYSQPKAVL